MAFCPQLRVLSFLILLIFSTHLAWSPLVFARDSLVPGSRYTSGRAAAMGEAYLPLGDDVASGLFYNPANLGRIRKGNLELINMSGYANDAFVGTADSQFYKVTSLGNFLPTLSKQPGKMPGFGGALLPNFGFPGFGLGILYQSRGAAKLNPDGTVTYRGLYQFVPAMGVGFRWLDGLLRWGYSLQWVNEASGTETAEASSSLGYASNLKQGSGFSHTLGMSFMIPIRNLPSFNVVVRNLMGTRYQSSALMKFSNSPSGVLDEEPMTFDTSFSLHPRLGRGVVANLVIEEKDLSNRTGIGFLGRTAVGAEFDFRNKLFLRSGWNSGYMSAGIGMRRPGAELSMSLYTVEVGNGYKDQGDVRYMIQYHIRNF